MSFFKWAPTGQSAGRSRSAASDGGRQDAPLDIGVGGVQDGAEVELITRDFAT